MDFFASQKSSKQQSRLLVAVFAVSLLAVGLLMHLLISFVLSVFNLKLGLFDIRNPAVWLTGLFWLICIAGSISRLLDAKAGGGTLARRYGATPLVNADANHMEKQLLHVVEEMAMASGCNMPAVFLMENDYNVNAFFVGSREGSEALVLSYGAMEALNSEQLAALVAHEFSHIVHGDLEANMRLMIVLSGLNSADELGKKLLATTHFNDARYSPLGVLGLFFRVFGRLGVWVGQLIRAAFLRQREFLADAAAVQYTRNAPAMASLLAYIQDQRVARPIKSIYAEEFSHFCFQVGESTGWWSQKVSSHPPIQFRLDAVDPHYSVKARAKVQAKTKRREDESRPIGLRNAKRLIVRESAQAGPNLNSEGVSDRISLLLCEKQACLAFLHAVFVSADEKNKQLYFNAIAFAYNKLFAQEVFDLADALEEEIKNDQLLLIDYACARLCKSIKLDNRQRLLKSLEKLLLVEGEFTLMNYATLQLIRRKIDAEFPVLTLVKNDKDGTAKTASAAQVKPFAALGNEFALLLSLVVESAGPPSPKQNAEFERVLKCYTKEALPRRSKNEPGVIKELEHAFQTLYVQPLSVRQSFVQHCVEIAQSDGYLARAEEALLELFAASLHCEAA